MDYRLSLGTYSKWKYTNFYNLFRSLSNLNFIQVNCKYDIPIPKRYRKNEQSASLYQEAQASNFLQDKIRIINSTGYCNNSD